MIFHDGDDADDHSPVAVNLTSEGSTLGNM